MIPRYGLRPLILVLALLTGSCSAHRFTGGPSDGGPILGDLTTAPEPYATGGPSQQDVDHLTTLLAEARNALYAGDTNQAERPRLSPITKTDPSGTGPAFQAQLPVIGPRQPRTRRSSST